MSSSIAPDSSLPSVSETAASSWSSDVDGDDFDYTPISPWGPVALVLGIASLTAFTNNVFGIGLAAISILVGIGAAIRLWTSRREFRGLGFAATGAVISILCLVFGSMKLAHAYETECPEGYRRTSFPNEISDREFVFFGPQRRLHPDVAPLIGQKLFLKGFMWQTQKSDGLTEFVFLKDNGECCFGGSPKPFDMMVVRLKDGKTTRAYTCMVAVSGVLNANVNAGEGEPVYTIDADIVEEAQTSF